MNTPEYRKAYMANLNSQIASNNKHLAANKGQPATNQYINNGGNLQYTNAGGYKKTTKK
jgi:hypothetical protein